MQNSVQNCMTIMCIIVTEEDLCKKHVTKSALFCQYAFLPQKCCPAVVVVSSRERSAATERDEEQQQ